MSEGRASEEGVSFRLLSGAKISRTRLTLKLERREEISVEGAAEKDEYENVVQGSGDRCG